MQYRYTLRLNGRAVATFKYRQQAIKFAHRAYDGWGSLEHAWTVKKEETSLSFTAFYLD